ncbi:MAG TPA: hypothetical protein O0X27_02130 [Methanocorpusculum sp.]|nr:hypothetical protein [Methanocorpusculum sp.]
MPQFTCPRCGAPLEVNSGTHIVTCPNCQTPTYIDRRGAIFFYQIPFSLDEKQANGVFKRWTAGPDRAKDLELTVKITQFKKEYFPVFSFKRSVDGKDTMAVYPARSTLLPGMHLLRIPPGDLTPYTGGTLDAPILEPDVPIDSCMESLAGTAISQSLIYFPIYEVEYTYKGQTFSLVIDGSSGDIFTGVSPNRSSASFVGVMGLATLIGFVGALLGCFVSPIFFLICIGGLFAGKILGHAVAKDKKAVAK